MSPPAWLAATRCVEAAEPPAAESDAFSDEESSAPQADATGAAEMTGAREPALEHTSDS